MQMHDEWIIYMFQMGSLNLAKLKDKGIFMNETFSWVEELVKKDNSRIDVW